MVWDQRSAFSGFPTGWLQERKQEQPRDSLLVDFTRVLVVFIWFCYGLDMVLIRFWYGFDIIFIQFWYDFDTVLIWFRWVGFKKRKQKQPRDSLLVDFTRVLVVFIWFCYGLDMVLIRLWYNFYTILIWFRYGFDMVPVSWLQKKETETTPGQVFSRFFAGFCDFDMILIWFWKADFDTILIRFWIGVNMVWDMVPVGWLHTLQFWISTHIKNHKLSRSYLKPYQHHKCKTTPGTITPTNHIWNLPKLLKTHF